jgi:excisionase family DNA binding protein
MSERLLTVNEVADALRIGVSSVYKAVAAGQLPAVRLGRSIRLSPEEVRRWVERSTVVGGTGGETQRQDDQTPARRGVNAVPAGQRALGAPDLGYPAGRRRAKEDQRVRPLLRRSRGESQRDPGGSSG